MASSCFEQETAGIDLDLALQLMNLVVSCLVFKDKIFQIKIFVVLNLNKLVVCDLVACLEVELRTMATSLGVFGEGLAEEEFVFGGYYSVHLLITV